MRPHSQGGEREGGREGERGERERGERGGVSYDRFAITGTSHNFKPNRVMLVYAVLRQNVCVCVYE